jgi:hypothetical protein
VPHTEDPILLVNRFCNVNREHDAVTLWVKEHVRDREDFDHDKMLSHLLVARVFNNPASLQHVIPFTNLDTVQKKMEHLRATGHAAFRGAYMMVVHGKAGAGKSAVQFYCSLAKKLRLLGVGQAARLEDVANLIISVNGLGQFMANQVVTDLRYTRFYPKELTPDWTTFIWPGPGTLRGIRRYHGANPVTGRKEGAPMLNHKATPAMILQLREDLKGKLPTAILEHFEDPNNLSNCLCEFDKYERVLGTVPSGLDRKATLRKYKA